MAKFEEKDPRWIVEEREDGTNVKNWHWTEKDCFAWTQTRLAELLSDVSLTDSSKVTAKTNNICQVKGEAFINNRKNKIFASFELEIKIGYVGTMKNEEGVMVAGDGNIVVPNFSDEQDPEDWAFLVVPTKEDKNGETIKADILLNGREKLRALLETLVDELKSGVPVEKHGNTESKPNVENKPKKTKENSVSRPSVSSGGYFRELHLKERFQANPKDIFDCFTIPQKFQAFTLDAAQMDVREGGEFEWFGGSVHGQYLEIEPPKKLTMKWRFKNWENDQFSNVTITLNHPEPGWVELILDQTQIPEEDKFGNNNVLDVVETGWKSHIFTRIKTIFGYGI